MIIHFEIAIIFTAYAWNVWVHLLCVCLCAFFLMKWNDIQFLLFLSWLQINTHHSKAFFWFHWWFPRLFFALIASYSVARRMPLSSTVVALMLMTASTLTAPNVPRHFDEMFVCVSNLVTWRFDYLGFSKSMLLITRAHENLSRKGITKHSFNLHAHFALL